jgi:hypothetical protein
MHVHFPLICVIVVIMHALYKKTFGPFIHTSVNWSTNNVVSLIVIGGTRSWHKMEINGKRIEQNMWTRTIEQGRKS